MSEKLAWIWLRNVRVLDGVHLQRVENALKRGVLDVEGCYQGLSFWLELKAGPMPENSTSLVRCEPLKPAQLDFISQRRSAGGVAVILYRVGSGAMVEHYLVNGRDSEWVAPRPTLKDLRAVSLVSCYCDPEHVLEAIRELSRD